MKIRELNDVSRLKSFRASAILTAVAVLLSPAIANEARTGSGLFPEGNFETPDGNGWVAGWPDVPNPNDAPWKGGARMKLEEEQGNHFVRVNTNPDYPTFYRLGASIALPEGTKKLSLSVRSRGRVDATPDADWRGARLTLQFYDHNEDPIKDAPSAVLGDIQKTQAEWKKDERTLDVPEGARSLYVRLIVGGLVGEFDFDDLVVSDAK